MRSAEPLAAIASTSPAHTESTKGSSARIRGGLRTDARILRIFVWPGGFDSPSWSSSGVRVSSSSGENGACGKRLASRLISTTSS